MTQSTITASVTTQMNGGLYNFNGTVWNDIWTQASADNLTPVSGGQVDIGAIDSPPRPDYHNYFVKRLGLIFDLTGYAGISLSSTVLRSQVAYDSPSPGLVDLVVTNGAPTYPHNPVVVGDYNKSHYSGNGGQLVGGSGTGQRDITLNATGLGWVTTALGGTLQLCLRTSNDIAGTQPTNNSSYWRIASTGSSSPPPPQLILTYATITPSDIMSRVSGLVHRFQTGKDGAKPIYQLEIYTGGLSSYSYAPLPNQPTPSLATLDYTALAGKQWFGHQIYYDIHGMFFVFLGPVGNQYRYDVTIWYLQNFGKGF